MKFKNVLLLYKHSAYKIYFIDKNSSIAKLKGATIAKEKKRFEQSHAHHYNSLRLVSKTLLTQGVPFTECYRGRDIDYSKYDLIITIGGDGTFLESSRKIKHQVIIGVNSAPGHSVGRFCIADAQNFERVFQKILKEQYKIVEYHRLRFRLSGVEKTVDALNDILACHSNPAMLGRYSITIGGQTEEQRSSGIWISTAVGSSGGIRSAGGDLLNPYDKKIQYKPRELYNDTMKKFQFIGGVLKPRQTIKVISLNRKGKVYCDGAHHSYPFDYTSELKVSLSPHPIRTIKLK